LRDNPVYFPPYAEGFAASAMVQALGPLRYASRRSLRP
jgi:hypothetical protein